MAKVKKAVVVFICERCEHEWVPRDPEKPPKVCPSCKSPYWDRPRKPQQKGSRT
jgi:rubrerythrin